MVKIYMYKEKKTHNQVSPRSPSAGPPIPSLSSHHCVCTGGVMVMWLLNECKKKKPTSFLQARGG